jgi:hypothetical protein
MAVSGGNANTTLTGYSSGVHTGSSFHEGADPDEESYDSLSDPEAEEESLPPDSEGTRTRAPSPCHSSIPEIRDPACWMGSHPGLLSKGDSPETAEKSKGSLDEFLKRLAPLAPTTVSRKESKDSSEPNPDLTFLERTFRQQARTQVHTLNGGKWVTTQLNNILAPSATDQSKVRFGSPGTFVGFPTKGSLHSKSGGVLASPPCDARPMELTERDGNILKSMPNNLAKFEADLKSTVSNTTLKTQEQHLRSACLNLSVAEGLLDALTEAILDFPVATEENPSPSPRIKDINPDILKQHLHFLSEAMKEATQSSTSALINTVFQRRDSILGTSSKSKTDKKSTLLNSSVEVMTKELRRQPLQGSSFFPTDIDRVAKRKADDAQNAMIATAKSLTQEFKYRQKPPPKRLNSATKPKPKRHRSEGQQQRNDVDSPRRDFDRNSSRGRRPNNFSPPSVSSYAKRGGA